MSPYVIAAPEALGAASADLTGIGSTISAANAAAAASTTGIAAAAGDEVSAAVAALFGTYAQDYQALSAQTTLFHEQFAQALTSGAGAYAAAEAANASPLQTLEQDVLGAINAPTNAVLGRPLIGNGGNGAAGTGHAGGAGGDCRSVKTEPDHDTAGQHGELHARRPAAGRCAVHEDRVRTGEGIVEARGPALVAVRGGQRLQPRGVPSDQQQFGDQPIAVAQGQATLGGDRQQVRHVLRGAHPAGGAVDDDADAPVAHGCPP